MVQKEGGLAPLEWISGQKQVYNYYVGRRDGKDFTVKEYRDLHRYIMHLMDIYSTGHPPTNKYFTDKSLNDWLEAEKEERNKVF